MELQFIRAVDVDLVIITAMLRDLMVTGTTAMMITFQEFTMALTE